MTSRKLARRVAFCILAFWWIVSAIDIPFAMLAGRREQADFDTLVLFVIPCAWDLCCRKIFNESK